MAVNYLNGTNPAVTKLLGEALKQVNKPVESLFSVLGRHAARALEAKVVADKCLEWAMDLDPSKPVHTKFKIPDESTGMGLTDAPRGALGHWISIKDKKIDRCQCMVPTTWNASPRDNKGKKGPVEQALIGTPVVDPDNAIEALRVVRSFDPCLACAIHLIEPGRETRKFRVL